MRPRPPLFILLFAFATLLWATGSARANDVALSKEHFKRAIKLAELGKHAEAIREFELAYEANPRPSMLYNIAHEHKALAAAGAIEEMRLSVDFYQRYLMAVPRAPDRKEVEAMVIELKANIATAEAESRNTAMKRPSPPMATTTPRATSPAAPAAGDGAGPSTDTRAAELNALPPQNPPPAPAPAHKMPLWGWGLVGAGAGVVVVGAVGLGIGLSQQPREPGVRAGVYPGER